MQSKVSGHWTDHQLIEHLYGVGPEGDHLRGCSECQDRLSAMQSCRLALEPTSEQAGPGAELLARQRRRIYAKLAEPAHWWSETRMRRWASAAATLLVLGGGLMVYEEYHQQELVKDQVSDAQLADQVSSMTQDSEPQPTAPLEALFEE